MLLNRARAGREGEGIRVVGPSIRVRGQWTVRSEGEWTVGWEWLRFRRDDPWRGCWANQVRATKQAELPACLLIGTVAVYVKKLVHYLAHFFSFDKVKN